MKRSPAMQFFVTQFANEVFGATEADHCVNCKGPKGEFKDKLSEKEYSISGLCQFCQDQIFKED